MTRIPMNATKMEDIKNIGKKPEHNKPKKDYHNEDQQKESTPETKDGSGWF